MSQNCISDYFQTGLDAAGFAAIMQRSNPALKNPQMIWKSTLNEDFFLSSVREKEDPTMKAFHRHPLSFREITLYGRSFKEQLLATPENAQLVKTSLVIMVENKREKTKKQNRLYKLICLIYDIIRNVFSGLGFKSTLSLAEELCKELNVAVPKKELVTPRRQIKPTLQRQKTTGKTQALSAYKTNPKSCSDLHKRILFQDIKKIDTEDPFQTSVVSLMKACSGLDVVDLKNEMCSQVVYDTFLHCNKETGVELVKWLSQQETFHPALLRRSLIAFNIMEQQQKPYDPYALRLLVETYVEREWGKSAFSLSDPILVEVVAQLVDEAPNEESTAKIVRWISEQKGFNLEMLQRFMKVFRIKEETIGKGLNMHYPLRDELVKFLKAKREWIVELKDDYLLRQL